MVKEGTKHEYRERKIKLEYLTETKLAYHLQLDKVILRTKLLNMKLKELDGKPTEFAIDNDYCKSVWSKTYKKVFYVWNYLRVKELFEEDEVIKELMDEN